MSQNKQFFFIFPVIIKKTAAKSKFRFLRGTRTESPEKGAKQQLIFLCRQTSCQK